MHTHRDLHAQMYTRTQAQMYARTQAHSHTDMLLEVHTHTYTHTVSAGEAQSPAFRASRPRVGQNAGMQGWGSSPVMGVGSRQVKQHCPGPSHHSSRGQSSSGQGVKEHSTSPFWKRTKGTAQ